MLRGKLLMYILVAFCEEMTFVIVHLLTCSCLVYHVL